MWTCINFTNFIESAKRALDRVRYDRFIEGIWLGGGGGLDCLPNFLLMKWQRGPADYWAAILWIGYNVLKYEIIEVNGKPYIKELLRDLLWDPSASMYYVLIADNIESIYAYLIIRMILR